MTHPNTSPANEAERLPRHTTPTWEVEMLISGAAVFAMLQFPGWLGAHLLPLMPRFAEDSSIALFLLYAYLTSTAIILAITFASHLVLRAHWIALVGVHSVFPDGVRWESLRIGRTLREVLQRRDRGAAASIESADNRASMVFAFGVMMAMTLLWLSLIALLAFAVSMVIGHTTHRHINALYVFFSLGALVMLLLGAATLLDRAIGRRLRPGGTPQRMLSGIFTLYARTGLLRGFSVARVLESHIGPRRFQWLTLAVVMPVITGVVVSMLAWSASVRIGDYEGFPHFAGQSRRAVAAAHYDDQRDVMHDPVTPYIQSEVVTGPYLKLVVPYSPRHDTPALQRTCPAARLARTDNTHADAVLDCLAALHAVTLDGKALTSLRYDAASDPRTDRPALQAMVDVRSLAPGRHELRVARAPPAPGSHDRHDRAWVIPFWY